MFANFGQKINTSTQKNTPTLIRTVTGPFINFLEDIKDHYFAFDFNSGEENLTRINIYIYIYIAELDCNSMHKNVIQIRDCIEMFENTLKYMNFCSPT